MNHCTNCGSAVPANAKHCPHCGNPLAGKKASPFAFYLTGLLLLVVGGILLGNYLGLPPFSFLLTVVPFPGQAIETPTQTSSDTGHVPTRVVSTNTVIPPTSVSPTSQPPTPIVPSENPIGKIVYTCQIERNENRNQICVVNADGSNQRRLTTDDHANHYYASLSSDGMSIVFSSNQTGSHEIYEMDLNGHQTRLTSMGELYAPEISPEGKYIAFTKAEGTFSSIWIMNRDGTDPHVVFSSNGIDAVDPTWSPDGKKILFALGMGDNKKLHTIDINGSNLRVISGEFTTRGRSDWSPDGTTVAGYTGGSWQRKIYLMNIDGSGLIELFSTGNVQAPIFSPDGGWVAFTGYIDNMGNGNGCEIYILKLRDEKLERLTNNDYCGWQPRWGP